MDNQQVDQFHQDQKKMLHRYIPQFVLNQLNYHLDSLPVQIKWMVIILQECGMRLNELCSISFDCLYRDAAGNRFLRYERLKIKEECTIPVSNEVAAIIIEQQKALVIKLSEVPNFLFPNPNGKPFSQKTFLNALNHMAYEKNIRNTTGEVWRFQARQFHGTHIMQIMSHRSSSTVLQRYYTKQPRVNVNSSYTHLFARQLEEWMAYHLSQKERDELAVLLARMRSVNPQSFGYCTLPLKEGPCQHTVRYSTPTYIHYFPIPDLNNKN